MTPDIKSESVQPHLFDLEKNNPKQRSLEKGSERATDQSKLSTLVPDTLDCRLDILEQFVEDLAKQKNIELDIYKGDDEKYKKRPMKFAK